MYHCNEHLKKSNQKDEVYLAHCLGFSGLRAVRPVALGSDKVAHHGKECAVR